MLIIGKAHYHLGKYSQAMSRLEDAVEIASNLGSRKAQWEIEHYMGKCLLELGQQHQADRLFADAYENLKYLLDHLSDPNLKEAFLSRQEVSSLISRINAMEKLGE
jgi:tetratricopeptide (TPR) repeat protein